MFDDKEFEGKKSRGSLQGRPSRAKQAEDSHLQFDEDADVKQMVSKTRVAKRSQQKENPSTSDDLDLKKPVGKTKA
jgi:hypothetical protein